MQISGEDRVRSPLGSSAPGRSPEAAQRIGLGADRLAISRDGAGPRQIDPDKAREFVKGFNRGADRHESMAAGGFLGAAIGGTMLAYGLTTAGVALTVPVIGGLLLVGGAALLGIGIYGKLRSSR